MAILRASYVFVAASLAVGVSSALAGPDWVEGGFPGGEDAGSTIDTAQPILSSAPIIESIFGSLSDGPGPIIGGGPLTQPDLEDMYLLRILQPTSFSFRLSNAGFDASLFLFNVTQPGEAFGLLGNLNESSTSNIPRIIRPATDGTGATVVNPGVYALAITGNGRVPVSMNGPIFNFASPFEISGADGPGGINPHTGWTGTGQTGTYVVEMTGVGRFDVPTPGAAAMLAMGALVGARRRRR